MISKNVILSVLLLCFAGQAQAMVNRLLYKIQNMLLGITNEKLFKAVQTGNCERIKQLIERGVDVNAKKIYPTPDQCQIAAYDEHEKVIFVFAAKKSNFYLSTPMHCAAYNGSKKAISALIEGGADVNTKDSNNFTPIHCAAYNGHEEVISTLVQKGADINVKDSIGTSPMHCAAYSGHEKAIHALVQSGADVNTKNSEGLTPMHMAAYTGHEGAILALVQKGADVNVKDFNGFTPIDIAASQKIRDMLKKIDEDR